MKYLSTISREFTKTAVAVYPKWWSRLTYEEQKEYIHDHPGTKLRVTAPRPAPATGQDPITADHYVIRCRAFNKETGAPVGGVIHEIVNVRTNPIFEGAQTLQDIVDKYEGSWNQPGSAANVKVLKIRPKKRVSDPTAPVSTPEVKENKKPVISDKPLVVGNMAQKILFLTEMQGQISDGQWENARGDHWRVWSKLDWDKVGVGDNIGRKFYARRDGYNFTNPELLDVVGDRMLTKVNLYKKHPKIVEPILKSDHWLIPDSYQEAKDIFEGRHIRGNDPNDYYAKKRQKLIDSGLTLEMIKDAEENPVYTKKDMIRDLKGLKKAFKPEGTYNKVEA